MLSTTLGLFLRKDTRRPRLILALVAAVILSTLAGAIPAAAQNRTSPLYTLHRDSNVIRSIDPLTGQQVDSQTMVDTAVAPVTIDRGFALALSPDGDLYGIVSVGGDFDDRRLALIDPTTGDVTLIDPVTLGGVPVTRISDLTFGSDGTLYGVTGAFGPAPQNALLSIDPATAEAAELADLSLLGDFNNGNAIAFNPDDSLIYHITRSDTTGDDILRSVDPAALDIPASISAPIPLTVDGFLSDRPDSIDFFGNGFLFVLDQNGNMWLLKATGELRFVTANNTGAGPLHGLAFTGTPPTDPQILYGAAHIGSNGPSLFYTIDPSDGTPTLIGPTGLERVSGIAMDSAGVIFGIGETMDGNDLEVTATIDPLTGLATVIDDTGNGGFLAQDLSFDADDNLFGTSGGDFITCDTTTGICAVLGALDSGFEAGHGLAFDADANLWHVWSTFNTSDAGMIDSLDVADGSSLTSDALPLPGATNQRVNALVFDPFSGNLLGTMADGGGGGGAPATSTLLVVIDPTIPDTVDSFGTQLGLDALALDANVTDLEIAKVADVTEAEIDDPATTTIDEATVVTFTITVTNNGPADATNVVVEDTLPANFEVDTVTPTQGTCSGDDPLICELGDLAVAASAEIVLVGTATAEGFMVNTATVAADQSDFDSTNNTAEDTVKVGLVVDLAVTKTGASADPATIEVTYTITVTNLGPDDATGVVLRDRFPTPDLFIVTSITPDQGNCDETGSTRFCRLGDLALGDVATIDVSGFSFSAGTRNNRINISAVEQVDSNAANSSASFLLDMRSYSIAVTPSRTVVAAGSTGVYEVTVTPAGGPITGVVALACANISGSVTLSCSFNPATVGFGVTGDVPGTSTLTVTPGAATAHLAPPPSSQPSAPLFAVWLGLPVLAFIGLRAFGGTRRRTAVALAMLTLLVLSLLPLAGCNQNAGEVAAPPVISTFRVQGSIGNATIPAPSFTSIEVQQ